MTASAAAGGKCPLHYEDGGRRKCHRRVGHHGPHHADSGLAWGGSRRGTHIRARHYGDCPGHGGFMVVAALFVPRTWPPWLIFLNFTCLTATLAVPVRQSWIPFSAAMLSWAVFFFMSLGIRIERRGGLFRSMGNILRGRGLTGEPNLRRLCVRLGAVLGSFIVGTVVLRLLSFLVVSGQNVATAPHEATIGASFVAQAALPLVLVWLLFGVPDQAHRIGLNKDEYTQRILVGVVAAVACVLTGAFFLTLHIGGGILGGIALGPLIVGIVFTAVLVWPFYKSLTRVIWQRGLRGVFSRTALKEPWRKISKEIQVALNEHAKGEATVCSEKAPAAKRPDRKDDQVKGNARLSAPVRDPDARPIPVPDRPAMPEPQAKPSWRTRKGHK